MALALQRAAWRCVARRAARRLIRPRASASGPPSAGTYLKELRIKDFALIEEQTVQFCAGLNVVTGGSGSGKSLIVDAVSQACGAPLLEEHIRAPATSATLEATFMVGPAQRALVAALLQDTGLDPASDESTLVLRRELQAVPAEAQGGPSTRSACRVNGRPVPLRVLRLLGSALVDVNGQGAAMALGGEESASAAKGTVLSLLDARARCAADATRFGAALVWARTAAAEAAAAAARAPGSPEEAASLAALVADVDAAAPQPGEDATLRATLKRLEARRLACEAVAQAAEALGGGALESLKAARRELRSVQTRLPARADGDEEDDSTDAAAHDALDAALELVAAAAEAAAAAEERCGDVTAALHADAAEREEAAARLRNLERLFRRHGCRDADALLAASADATSRLGESEGSATRTAQLESAARASAAELGSLGVALAAARAGAARALEAAADAQLAQLCLPGARLRVRLRWEEAEEGEEGPSAVAVPTAHLAAQDPALLYAPTASGLDRATLLFSPAPGEPLRPLAAAASGGERARVMLALKAAAAAGFSGDDGAGPPVSLFDEADAGVGGAAGAAVGAALRRLSGRGQQVLCVTHLPQVAAFADRHFTVSKGPSAQDGRVTSSARPLGSREERAAELAAMLALGADAGEQLLAAADAVTAVEV